MIGAVLNGLGQCFWCRVFQNERVIDALESDDGGGS